MATLKSIKNKYLSYTDGAVLGVTTNTENISALSFKLATADGLSKFNLVDGFADDYQDITGIDTGTSTDETYDSSGKYWSGSSLANANYWGDSSDGSLSTSGNVTWTVPNKVGSYDGDMVIKQYSALTINAGHTITVDQPNRGIFIYVDGDCTIAGTLTMTNKGGASDPTASGGSDSNAVGASGLQIGLKTSGGTSTFTNDGTGFNGAGTGVRTAIANQNNLVSNGTIFAIPRNGGLGGSAAWTGASLYNGVDGGTVTNSTGGGGQGSGSFSSSAPSTSGDYANGGLGGVFGGGSGGGGMSGSGGNSAAAVEGTNATDYGGAGGNGVQDTGHGSSCEEGGAGNPSGTGVCAGASCSPCNLGAIAGSGGGGIIWLLVKGDLTITGTISANGSQNARGATSNNHGAGSSGGGVVNTFYAGTLSNSGSITVAGGASQTGSGAHKNGGAGGAGSTQSAAVLLNETISNNMTLQSNAFTAQSAPTTTRIILDEEAYIGTTVLDTDIKAYASRDNGTTYTQITLADQGQINYLAGIDTYTKLMLHCDGANGGTTFTDSSGSAHTVTAQGSTHTDTAIKKFGTASAQFGGDGTGDDLVIPDSTDWDIGTGNFTFDTWIYPTDNGSSYRKIFASGGWGGGGAVTGEFDWVWDKTDAEKLRFIMFDGTDIPVTTSTATIANDVWTHVAVVRSGSTITQYINGTADGTLTSAVNIVSHGALQVGRAVLTSSTTQMWQGYIDELRVSKGIARWTANFTPPATAYTHNRRLLSGSVDISGQPAGTNMKYKIETLNQASTKQTRIYGTSMAWA